MVGIALDNYIKPEWFKGWVRIVLYVATYIPVGLPVLKDAINSIRYSDFFSEFFLMSIATLGALLSENILEGVAVMLFYSVGEVFQTMAVQRAKRILKDYWIRDRMKLRFWKTIFLRLLKPETAQVGQIIQLKPGEKLALDGELISESASFNTAALTGESKPDTKRKAEAVLAGMINLNSVSQVLIQKEYKDSKLSKILELVQNATSQKHQQNCLSGNLLKYILQLLSY